MRTKQMGSEGRLEVKSRDSSLGTRETWPKVAIIVLNWNGWRDTIECLESLQQLAYPNYQVIVVDNGSTDDSVGKIKAWANGGLPVESKFFQYDSATKPVQWIEHNCVTTEAGRTLELGTELDNLIPNPQLVLIKSRENLGFARGNNLGIKYALRHNFNYVFLLNNDAIIMSDALRKLVSSMICNPRLGAATAKIYYYDDPERVWNAGGRLTMTGSRKYYDSNLSGVKAFDKGALAEITLVTGCSLLIRTDIITRLGSFSEDFFHGEEDYNFSLRMKKHGIKMGCVHNARVYHKGGRSIQKLVPQQLDSAFIHYLNRFVDLKTYYPRFYWRFWRYGALCYILPMLYIRYHIDVKSLIRLSTKLIMYSSRYDRVTKELISQVQNKGI